MWLLFLDFLKRVLIKRYKMEQKFILMFISIIIMITQENMIAAEDEGRIGGGKDVPVGQRRYQVSLQTRNSRHFCGGSIISKYFVLSAAHCLVGQSASNIKVVIGTIDLTKPYKTRNVSKIIIHRQYSQANSFKNDISLLKVSSRMDFDSRVQPVSLPRPHTAIKDGTPAIVSGWGRLLNSSLPTILQEVTVYIVNQAKCRKAVGEQKFNIYPTNICADDDDPTTRAGECNGDSGGPLTVNNTEIGIVSWSIKDPSCGSNKYPGIFTRVSEYIDWIRNNMN